MYNVHREGVNQKIKPEDEWVRVKDHHPAIVSVEQKERINEMLSFNVRGKRAGRSYTVGYPHVFNGIVHCSTCGRLMHVSLLTMPRAWRSPFTNVQRKGMTRIRANKKRSEICCLATSCSITLST